MIWSKSDVDFKDICKHYYCKKYKCHFDLKKIQKNNTTLLDEFGEQNADLCIQECAENSEYRCNIKECQQMCIECETPSDKLSKQEKVNVCAWYNNIKLNIKKPEPPYIIGTPLENGNINISWKKPFNNAAKITHYLLEIKEASSKYKSRNLITIIHNNTPEITHDISDLKKQTTYEINLSAVNIKGISVRSNKINITTKGDNKFFNIFNDSEYKEYKCIKEFNNSDHILDKFIDDEINIYDSVKSMDE